MPLSVFLIVFLAAPLHVVERRRQGEARPFLAMTLIALTCAALVVGLPRSAGIAWIVASIVIHFGYYVFLAQAYRLADMSQVYPIARGAALLMTVWPRSWLSAIRSRLAARWALRASPAASS